MNILFYIEPVVFRQEPSLLMTWIWWIEEIAQANPEAQFAIVSSAWLCDRVSNPTIVRFPISAHDATKAYDFERLPYVKSLFDDRLPDNQQLLERLRPIDKNFQPQVVVSFTENRFLKNAFSDADIFYTEIGSTPRIEANQTFFLDPCGHQNGIMNDQIERLLALEPPLTIEQSDTIWNKRSKQYIETHPLHEPVKEWLSGLKGKPIRLLALQPNDWLTYDGVYEPIPEEEIIYKLAMEMPDAVLVPTHHRGQHLSQDMQAYISNEFPNVIFPPAEIATGVTELFAPYIDELITISSTVGMVAVLEGKAVRTLGTAAFSKLAEAIKARQGNPIGISLLRRNILAFLSNQYLHLQSRCLLEKNYYVETLKYLSSAKAEDVYFNFSDWKIEKLLSIFRVEL